LTFSNLYHIRRIVSKSIFFNLYCWETFKNTVRPHPQTRVFAASAVTARNTANNLRLAHAVGASACRAKCFTVSSLCQPCSQTYLCRQQSSRPQTICGVASGCSARTNQKVIVWTFLRTFPLTLVYVWDLSPKSYG